jgi:hypothetical protein
MYLICLDSPAFKTVSSHSGGIGVEKLILILI